MMARWSLWIAIGLGLVFALIWALTPPAESAERVDAAIVFVMDVSGSMSAEEVIFAREAHARAIASEPMVSAIMDGAYGTIAASYVEFGDGAKVQIGWTPITDQASAIAFADQFLNMPLRGVSSARTLLGQGLLKASEALGDLPYEADRLIVDIVADGIGDDGVTVRLGREAILSRGAAINAMPIMLDPDQDIGGYYERIVGGPAHFVMPVDSIDQLPQALRSKIVLELF